MGSDALRRIALLLLFSFLLLTDFLDLLLTYSMYICTKGTTTVVGSGHAHLTAT
jgi:hypothetical protein